MPGRSQKTAVMAVDDEPALREAPTRRPSGRGPAVEPAKSGPRALERLAGRTCDVMAVDVKIPGMNGLSLRGQVWGSRPGRGSAFAPHPPKRPYLAAEDAGALLVFGREG